MEYSPFRILGLLLPSICLLYSVSWSAFSLAPLRHEAFGNAAYYLDIRLEGVPHRAISATGKDVPETLDFKGVLASESREEAIQGKRVKVHGQTWYFFNSSEGKVQAWLVKPTKGCEPELHFRVETKGQWVNRGYMRAGFCPTSS